jgi:ketosteroid isomerase-like protein
VIETVKRGFAKMNAEARGSSMQVRRVMLMEEPPSVDGHEITDKGLHQPARHAGPPQGLGAEALRRWRRRDRHRLTEEDMAGNGQTVIDLDRKRMQAMAKKDVRPLRSLIADDLIYTHSSARLDTKRSLIDNMTSGSTVYTAVEPSDVKAQDLGDTVVLTGIAQIKVTANGNPMAFGVRFTDVYAKRNGRWQMVTWQSTELP